MPTIRQQQVFESFRNKFGKTPAWRSTLRNENFTRLTPEEAYVVLGRLFETLREWTYRKLPRSAGLPTTDEGWKELRERAREEERVARYEVPDEEPGPIDDPRAGHEGVDYLELNPDLAEDLEFDYPGLRRRNAPRV